jgi:hypothetical protein
MIIDRAAILAQAAAEQRFEFARRPEHWAAVIAIAAFAAVLYWSVRLYRREARAGASPRLRFTLAAIRCVLYTTLAAIALEPVLVTYIRRTIESYTLVLVDGSASMQLADAYPDPADAERVRRFLATEPTAPPPAGGIRRAALVDRLLAQNNSGWLRRLAARNTTLLWQFGDEPELLRRLHATPLGQPHAAEAAPLPSAPPAAPPTFAGAETPATVTNLGAAVRRAVADVGNAPVAGIVVLSDGAINEGESADVIARYAKARNIPIFPVGIGDPAPPRNVRVAEVIAPANAFVKDPFAITANLVAQGLAGTALDVDLIELDGLAGRVVATERTTVDADNRVAPVTFRRAADTARTQTYAVHVRPLAVETITEDNRRQVTVRVLENKMRVLVIAGSPTWDYRYLVRLLERDPAVDVAVWLQSADREAVREGTTVLTAFPHTAAELFAYDALVLFDPQPDDFNAEWCKLTDTLVSTNGSGLLYVAGRKYTSRFFADPDAEALVAMLPIVPDPEAGILINALGRFQTQAWPPLIDPAVRDHPVLAIEPGEPDTTAIWNRLAGIYWHYPVLREKPVATVLMRHSNPRMQNAYGPHVLLATQFYGAGRTGYLGFDSTWRWRRYGEAYPNRFWIQLLRHLVEGKLATGGGRAVILTDRDTCTIGEAVDVHARVLDEQHQPLAADRVTLTLRAPERPAVEVTLDADPTRPGWFRGSVRPTRPGSLELTLTPPDTRNPEADTARHTVDVVQPNREYLAPQMHRAALTTLAANSAGGRYIAIDQADTIPDRIEDRRATFVVRGMPTILWQRYRWPLFAWMLGLLGIEWAMRKRARML